MISQSLTVAQIRHRTWHSKLGVDRDVRPSVFLVRRTRPKSGWMYCGSYPAQSIDVQASHDVSDAPKSHTQRFRRPALQITMTPGCLLQQIPGRQNPAGRKKPALQSDVQRASTSATPRSTSQRHRIRHPSAEPTHSVKLPHVPSPRKPRRDDLSIARYHDSVRQCWNMRCVMNIGRWFQ